MKTWVELTELVGFVYRKEGGRSRFIVHDITLGADLVLTPYRLRNSSLRFKNYIQIVISQKEFFENYKEVKP